jgi:hypothetical protein
MATKTARKPRLKSPEELAQARMEQAREVSAALVRKNLLAERALRKAVEYRDALRADLDDADEEFARATDAYFLAVGESV